MKREERKDAGEIKKQNLGGRVARPPEAKSLTLLEA